MTKKLETISLQGKAYATVPTRIKEFREMCPNGLIETNSELKADGSWIFRTRILRDKAVPTSGEAIGTSRGILIDPKSKVEIPKAFEKLETISIGRALAILGFMASGDVASFEEMEEFMSEKETQRQEKIQEMKEEVDKITTVPKLKEYWSLNRGYGVEIDAYITNKAKQLKEAK